MTTFKRIMAAVDFSDTALTAAHRAEELARELAADLLVVHVLHEPAFVMAYGNGYPSPAVAEQYQSEMRTRLHGVAELLSDSGAKVTSRLVHGTPHEGIVSTAQNDNIDLIVMGTHGRTGVSHLLLGSVAERVVRLSKVPVLTIRKP